MFFNCVVNKLKLFSLLKSIQIFFIPAQPRIARAKPSKMEKKGLNFKSLNLFLRSAKLQCTKFVQ